jgi:hypothetical protein
MERKRILKTKELAGGDDGARTRDLMRDRYVKSIAGVDSKGR